MHSNTHRFLTSLAQSFDANRLDVVANNFAYPMPFYTDDGMQVFGAASTLVEGLAAYRDAVRDAGATHLRPRIIAEGLRVRGYCNVWVEWDHLDDAGQCLRTNQVHYVLFQADTDLFPKIELVEYTVTAFPEVFDRPPMSATA